jgi:hypothetical protein
MYAGMHASWSALIEVQACRAGDREASFGRLHRFARIAAAAPSFGTTRAIRALGYAEELKGNPEGAIDHLAKAEAEARSTQQGIDIAIAQYQRGRLLGGDQGASLTAQARRGLASLGVGERLLAEW